MSIVRSLLISIHSFPLTSHMTTEADVENMPTYIWRLAYTLKYFHKHALFRKLLNKSKVNIETFITIL